MFNNLFFFLFFLIFYSLVIFITEVSYLNSSLSSFFVFFVQVSYAIISLTWWIVITTILFIGITFVIYLMPKIWRYFFISIFFYISSSILFWPFSWFWVSPIGTFLITEVYRAFFFLLLRGIKILSGVAFVKISPCQDKTETLKLSLWISISEVFLFW